jgi:hypothetical protein
MIQANELRLGNLILKNNEIYEISSLFFVDLHDGTIRENYNNSYIIEPIPLTEEWILKFGLKKTKYKSDIIYDFGLQNSTYITIDKNDLSYFMWDEYLTSIKYVHQLQNLYFALTNNELEIK